MTDKIRDLMEGLHFAVEEQYGKGDGQKPIEWRLSISEGPARTILLWAVQAGIDAAAKNKDVLLAIVLQHPHLVLEPEFAHLPWLLGDEIKNRDSEEETHG